MKVLVLLPLITSAFWLGAAHTPRVRGAGAQNDLLDKIKRMAGLQWRGFSRKRSRVVFQSSIDIEKELDGPGDWESSVETLFATFGENKIETLAKAYIYEEGEAKDDNISMESVKNILYRLIKNGSTDIADKMVGMDLDLNEVDLQELLRDSLRPDAGPAAPDWRGWLLTHGAAVDSNYITALFERATVRNDVRLLSWMKNHLIDADTSSENLAQWFNGLLPLAVRSGARRAAKWLLRHGANASELEDTTLLRVAMLEYLMETGGISLPLARHVRDIDASILNVVLYKAASAEVYNGRGHYSTALDHLVELGAKLPQPQLQELLHSSLSIGNWMMATWTVAQGAEINGLDLNAFVSKTIEDWKNYHRSSRPLSEPVDVDALFDFLRIHGLDSNKLNLQQLLAEAEEKNITAAAEQLRTIHGHVERASPTEVLQRLREELQLSESAALTDDAGNTSASLLQDAVLDYLDTTHSTVWLLLYMGRTNSTSSSTRTDMLLEVVRLLPYEGIIRYKKWTDSLIRAIGTVKEREMVAQSMLNHAFKVKGEEHPFPLAFARWAVATGADINKPDPHTLMFAVIDHEVIKNKHRDRPSLSNRLPNIVDVFIFLKNNNFASSRLDLQLLQRDAEEKGAIVTANLLKDMAEGN